MFFLSGWPKVFNISRFFRAPGADLQPGGFTAAQEDGLGNVRLRFETRRQLGWIDGMISHRVLDLAKRPNLFFSESRTAMSCVIFRGLSVWNVGANLSWGFNPEMNVKHKRFKSNVWKNYLHRVLKRRVHSWNSLAADACASQSIVCWTSIFFSPWFHWSMVSIVFSMVSILFPCITGT